ncbi:hypothetical protein ACL07V_37415 [Streptomyces sp. MB22_4]|uniref:hypothetical protein n=1 Tax=Streptomyces sp. MB22_4 TaxID=3383120 RepID=UPI00399F670F
MSIWSSIGGPDILALNGSDEAANYRAEGTPTIGVDVATTGHHDHIRLCLYDGADVEALLSPAAARMLRDRLDAALGTAPVRPDEEPEGDGPEYGGHDFQWGEDHVQRCARCTLPHSQWAGGLCPGPEHPLKPGEYV